MAFADPEVEALAYRVQTELQHAGSAFNNLIGEVRVNQAALGIVPDGSTDLWTSVSSMSVQLDRVMALLVPEEGTGILEQHALRLTDVETAANLTASSVSGVANLASDSRFGHYPPAACFYGGGYYAMQRTECC